MAFTVGIAGIQSQRSPETRNLVILDVDYDGTHYDWLMFAPTNVDLKSYVQSQSERIKKEIDLKEQEWAELDPKTRTISNDIGDTITIDISKDEIVKPDTQDYFAKRRSEYPPVEEQLDAIWKGVQSEDFSLMQQKIIDVKQKNPMILSESELDIAKNTRSQYITMMRNNTLTSLTSQWNGLDWDATETDSTRIANVLTMLETAQAEGIPVPPTINWRTYDNQDQALTKSQLVQLGASMFMTQEMVWGKQAALKNAIAAATTVEEVNNITW